MASKNHIKEKIIKLRGNKKWCEEFGEDLSLPRFIGDEKILLNGKWVYPPYEYQAPKKKKTKVAKNQASLFNKPKPKRKSKSDRKLWWRSLTAEEQLEYRCNKFDELGIPYNKDKEWSKILKENLYLK